AVVARVYPGSPAAVAGLAQNDVIVTFDSTPVEDYHHLQRLSADAEVGKTVKLGVVRSRERKSLELRIAEAPDRAADTTLPSGGRTRRSRTSTTASYRSFSVLMISSYSVGSAMSTSYR